MKERPGFSLLEVILSVAALMLISGFILQMFISSLYLDRKAYNLDMGTNAAAQALETFMSGDAPVSDGEVTRYFDSQWGIITIEQPETDEFTKNVNLILPDSVKLILTVSMSEESARETETYSSFDSDGGYILGKGQAACPLVGVNVYEVDGNKERREILTLNARKYLRTG